MSTRATYKFVYDGCDRDHTTLYLHHDGYPSGAACYFYNAIEYLSRVDLDSKVRIVKETGDKIKGAFYRSNERAEFTSGDHGDTEFRYTLDTKTFWLEVEKRKQYVDEDGREWEWVFSGDLIEFVNSYIDPKWVEYTGPVFYYKSSFGSRNMTTAKNALAIARQCRKVGATFDHDNGNRKRMFDTAMNVDEAFKRHKGSWIA